LRVGFSRSLPVRLGSRAPRALARPGRAGPHRRTGTDQHQIQDTGAAAQRYITGPRLALTDGIRNGGDHRREQHHHPLVLLGVGRGVALDQAVGGGQAELPRSARRGQTLDRTDRRARLAWSLTGPGRGRR
jgi:hypothetical protein